MLSSALETRSLSLTKPEVPWLVRQTDQRDPGILLSFLTHHWECLCLESYTVAGDPNPVPHACTASIWLAESPVQTPNVLILNTALGIFVHHIEKQKGKPQRMSLSSELLGPKRLTLTSDTALRQGWLVRCTFSCTHASLGSSAARSPQHCFPGQFRNGSLEKDGGATREKQKGL